MRTLIVGSRSHQGMVRSENQDSLGKFPEGSLDLSLPKGQLFIIADGMGGHKAGREASEIAVRTLAESYFSLPGNNLVENLKQAFQAANTKIYTQSTSDPLYAGMGTTCTVLVLRDNRGVIGHIGDSRVYRITRRGVTQLTTDHSRVADLVRRGIITKEQARLHPERSQLYRALGTKAESEVDFINPFSLSNDCYFLVCTDGLYNHVNEDEMQSIVLARPPEEASQALVELANERGGYDNITVQVIHFVSSPKRLKALLRKGRR